MFREEFPVKKGFLMVNVHNSKTCTLQKKDPALLRNVQHGDDVIRFAAAAGGQIGIATLMQGPLSHKT